MVCGKTLTKQVIIFKHSRIKPNIVWLGRFCVTGDLDTLGVHTSSWSMSDCSQKTHFYTTTVRDKLQYFSWSNTLVKYFTAGFECLFSFVLLEQGRRRSNSKNEKQQALLVLALGLGFLFGVQFWAWL